MFSVKDKTAIVTGAGSGINLCFARLLLAEGANVIVADLHRGRDSELYSKFPHQVRYKKCDVTNWKDLDDVFEFARSEFGGVQVLCSGAGVYEPPWSNFWSDTETESYKTTDINFTAPIRGARLAIREFLRQGKPGVILNISSIAAQVPRLSTPLYAATKAGISAFTRSLAPLEQRYGIKAVAVAPGVVRTELWTEHPEKNKMLTEDDAWVTPEEVAKVMLDLVQESKYPGGTILESAAGVTRTVEIDSPLPSAAGTSVSNEEAVLNDVFAILDKELLQGQPNGRE